jgi:hypothetical protein
MVELTTAEFGFKIQVLGLPSMIRRASLKMQLGGLIQMPEI